MSDESYNAESEPCTKEVEALMKVDAIGSTLYSQTWVMNLLVKMSDIKTYEAYEGLESEEEFLADIDALLGMSSNHDVCSFLAVDNAFAMVAIELALPSPFSCLLDRDLPSPAFASHCLRRHELSLIILSNIALRKDIVLTLGADDTHNIYLVDLPLTGCGFFWPDQQNYVEKLTQEDPHLPEYASVLTAFMLYFRNLFRSLLDLNDDGQMAHVQQLVDHLKDKISGKDVFDLFALILATSTNPELLKQTSKFLVLLFNVFNVSEFALDRRLVEGLSEAIVHCTRSKETTTGVTLVQVLTDVLTVSVEGKVLEQLCDTLTDLILDCAQNGEQGVVDCAVLSQLLQVVWPRLKEGCHWPTFQAMASFIRKSDLTVLKADENLDSFAIISILLQDFLETAKLLPNNDNKSIDEISEFLRELEAPPSE